LKKKKKKTEKKKKKKKKKTKKIWIVGLQTGCVGVGFEVTVTVRRIRVPKELEGREVESRDVKSETRCGVFEEGGENFDSKTGNFAYNPNLQF
jgi:hypothetical protein